MQVKSIAECSNGSILQYFRPSFSYHLSVRSLSIFEWPLKTGLTVHLWEGIKDRCIMKLVMVVDGYVFCYPLASVLLKSIHVLQF